MSTPEGINITFPAATVNIQTGCALNESAFFRTVNDNEAAGFGA